MAEDDVPDERSVGAAVVAPRSPWVLLFGLFGAALTAYVWASACPAKPLATFLEDQAESIGFLLCIFVFMPAVLVRKMPFQGLRELSCVVPLYLVGLVVPVASMTVGWEGGWILGIAGAAVGAGAGAAAGWLFVRWTLPDIENRHSARRRVVLLPIAFAVLFALFGAYSWAIEWLTPDHAWAIGLFPLVFAFLGGLVGRAFLSTLTALPITLLQLVPLVASMTVGWEGGWILGLAGAAVGAAAGAVNGWLYNRWIMPEYDKRRERGRAVRPGELCSVRHIMPS